MEIALNDWWEIRQEYLKVVCPDVFEAFLPAVEKVYGKEELRMGQTSTRREIRSTLCASCTNASFLYLCTGSSTYGRSTRGTRTS